MRLPTHSSCMASTRPPSTRGVRRLAPSTLVPSRATVVRAVLRGVKGGLIATFVMTLYRLPIFRSLPPTAEFWAEYVTGDEAESHLPVGLVLHALYGGVGGGAFGLVFDHLAFDTEAARGRRGLAYGLGYGLFLSLVGTRVVFGRLLDEDLDADETLVFHAGHVIYGLTLGTWLGTQEGFGDVYE